MMTIAVALALLIAVVAMLSWQQRRLDAARTALADTSLALRQQAEHHARLEEELRARSDELQVQQRRLEAVIEALPVSLTIKDREGRYRLGNRLFEEACGINKDRLLGHTAEELFPPAMAEQIGARDHELLGGMPMVRYENASMRRDGTRRDQLVTKVPLLDAEGEPEAILTLAIDISDQKDMQRELAAAKQQAEHLADVKSAFLANMSHEIRTPLHGVLGLAQLGQGLPPGDPRAQHILGQITRSGRHLLGVINDILDFSKIDAGKLTIDACAMDPRQIAGDALAMVSERASGKGVVLQSTCHDIPAGIMGDPLRIRQILINLLSNGIKFTPQGSVTLSLSAGHGHVYFAVRDTGIGMSQQVQARVFQPFEQADGSTSRRFGGTGLGLSISRKLARLMGGDITLDSAEGQGATFTLVLPCTPLAATELPPSGQLPTMLADAALERPGLTGLRILAADDVDINRDILAGLLTQQQAEVHCAQDGMEVLRLHENHGPAYFDIVLMDLQMPVMDGMQAAQALQQRDPGLPVVALTAHALPEERQRCLDAGMLDHLAKPFDAHDVIRLVRRHARRAPLPPPPARQPVASSEPLATVDLLSPATFDFAGALLRSGGQDALVRKLIGRFCDEQGDFADRCEALLAKDPDLARQAAHRLKGTCANLGLSMLARQAGELETALIDHDDEACAQALSALHELLARHIAQLRGWLGDPISA